MKRFVKIGIILAVVIIVLGPVKDFLIRTAVVASARAVAGVDVRIGYLSLSLWRQSVMIKDLKVYNPQGFPVEAVMVDIPEIAVKVDVPAIFKNTLHVPYMRLDLKEARVIKNRSGAMNVNSLKFAQSSPAREEEPAARKGPEPSAPKDMKMKLDLVSLNIGTIYIEDYTSGKDKPRLTVLKLNIKNSEFRDVTSPVELGSLVMVQALTPAGLDGAFSAGANILGEARGVVGSVVGTVGGLFENIRTSF